MKTIGPKYNKMLGVAVGDKSMLVAEVTAAGGAYQVTHVGQFVYGAGKSFAEPVGLGQAFAQFLKANGFTTRRAVFGLPAKWVLTKAKEVPAADQQTVAASLRLQAEGEFSPELKDLVYDYAGQSSPREASTLLLLATPRRNVDQIRELADAAKVDVQAVTVSVAALSAATSRVRKNSLVLSLGPAGAELGSQPADGPSVLRHVGPASAAAAPMLLGELRRATAGVNGHSNGGLSMGRSSTNGNGHAQRELILWDDGDTTDSPASGAIAACRTMGETAGLTVVDGELSSLGISSAPQAVGKGAATAAALAVEGMLGRLPIDFTDSRLAPPKEQRFDQRVVVGVGVGALALLIIIAGWFYQHRLETSVAQKKAQLASQSNNVTLYKSDVERIQTLLSWHNGTPRYLPCLVDLTRAFPQERDLYLVGFTMRQDVKGDLSGTIQGRVSGSNAAPVLTLLDRVHDTGRFSNVSQQGREGSDNKEAQFQINFIYVPQGTQAVAAPSRATAGRAGAAAPGSATPARR